MIKVLFKSEEQQTLRVRHKKYRNLSNLTPKNGEETMDIIMLLTISKYIVAKQIKVITKTEVVVKTAKSSMVTEDAAAKFNLEEEVQRELNNGATPLEALKEWDII